MMADTPTATKAPSERPRFLWQGGLLPPAGAETPAFVICEAGVLRNLDRAIAGAGGPGRLMPHVKTHRAAWIVQACRARGVEAFKAATLAEVALVAGTGAQTVTWAYPSVNPANIARLIQLAHAHPQTRFAALVDSDAGLTVWRAALAGAPANIGLRVDLDPGMGRTGAQMNQSAVALARTLAELGRFEGWHLYDGHLGGPRAGRIAAVAAEAAALDVLNRQIESLGLGADLVAGGSYSYDLWPKHGARYVSPGSWTFSSDQHDRELADLDWIPAAFVLATVVSRHGGTVTLDAGVKAISPDKPLAERFRTEGEIVLMSEEHSVVRGTSHQVGDRLLLLPRHACTTAYLYERAWVRTTDGPWERRPQLGVTR